MTAPQQTINDAGAPEIALAEDARVLAIDIGGSGLKAAILDLNGDMLSERVRVETPKHMVTDALLQALVNLIEPLGSFDVVSVGFPGVVRKGIIITAPNLGTKQLKGFNLQLALEKQLGKPVRVLNDADMQGFAAIKGDGVEMVITLGTGFGSALFLDGELGPHLEISHIPFRKGEDYDQQVGNEARKKIGKKRWNRRVQRAIKNLRILTNFDRLYIGGGNADKLTFELEPDIEIISNENGVRGGAWLWRKHVTSDK
ncbi:MAG TPA: ROK family protein [Blastocatellia bacterium]|nr:ROK family protein [Blastocatellia bacterium]